MALTAVRDPGAEGTLAHRDPSASGPHRIHAWARCAERMYDALHARPCQRTEGRRGAAGRSRPRLGPPSRRFVEQAINTLLPTRAYTSIEHVRCSGRMPDAPSDSDPSELDAFSHWACVGQEIRGRSLHEDVIWSPSSGYLGLNAVTRDLSPKLTLPKPNDPGLPNPYLPEESQHPTSTPSRSLSQRELARH